MKEKIKKGVVWMLCFLFDIFLIFCCICLFIMVNAVDLVVGNGVGWIGLFLWFIFVRQLFYKGMFSFWFIQMLNQEK